MINDDTATMKMELLELRMQLSDLRVRVVTLEADIHLTKLEILPWWRKIINGFTRTKTTTRRGRTK